MAWIYYEKSFWIEILGEDTPLKSQKKIDEVNSDWRALGVDRKDKTE